MPKYAFEHNGKRYAVTANSPEEAGPMIDAVHKHLSMNDSSRLGDDPMNEGQVSGGAGGEGGVKALDRVTDFLPVVGPIKTMAKGLGGEPTKPWQYGLAGGGLALDLATLGAGTPAIKGGEALISQIAKNAAKSSAVGLGAGAAVEGAKAAGVENPWALGALGIGGGLATGHAVNPGAGVKAVDPTIAKLESFGAKPTAAMRQPGMFSQSAELSARTSPYPWVSKPIAAADESMAEAARKMAKQSFGPDILEARGEKSGANLTGALDKMAEARSEQYKPALEALKDSKGFPGFKSSIIKAVDEASGDVSSVSKAAFKKALISELADKNTPYQIDKALTHVKTAFAKELGDSALVGQTTHDFQTMMNAAKEAHYTGLNNLSGSLGPSGESIKGSLGDILREAKGDYREASHAMGPMAKVLQGRSGKPESMGVGILSQGSGTVKEILNNADDSLRPQIQSELAKSIIGQAASKEGGISGAALKTLTNKTYKDILPLLGDEGQKLKELADALERGKIADLKTVNASGTGPTLSQIGEVSSLPVAAGAAMMGHPAALAAPLGKMAMDTAYSNWGVPIQKAANEAGAVLGPQLGPLAQTGIRKANADKQREEQLRKSKLLQTQLRWK